MASTTWQQYDEQDERLARLRGATLPATSPGARGIEHVQRNPACTLLRTITMAGAAPADVMSAVLHLPPREGQSPFAITAGLAFERHLAENGAAALVALYRHKGRLGLHDARLVDLSLQGKPSSAAAKVRHKALTRRLLRMKLQGDPQAPHLILKPRLAVSLLGVPHDVEPDALVASSQDRFYRVVEFKSYEDRHGKTEEADIRSACRQAAVGVYALRETLTELSVATPALYVPAVADLVLRWPGSMSPSLRSMALAGEYASIAGVLATPPQDMATLEALLHGIAPGATLSDRVVLDALPINYLPGCREHGSLVPYCKARALAAGDPSVLDPRYREVLAPAGDLGRAYALLDGTVTTYRSPEEQELAERLRAARDAWREAV